MKWAYFVNLSTTTKMMSLFSETSKPSTKSILMWVYAKSGIGSG
jgi:hypothetical protein